MNIRKLLSKISIVIVLVFCIMLVTSYAYYTFSGATTAFNVNTYNQYIEVLFESSEIINTTTALPISDSEVESLADSNNFTVNVVSGSDVAEVLLSISLVDINIDDALKNENFKYQLLRDGSVIKEGTGVDFTSNYYELTSKEVIYSSNNNEFTFRVWISDNGLDQSNMENKVFSASIEVNAVKIRTAKTLNSVIRESAILDTNIDFSKISSDTNGKGVYIRSGTQNDTNPIYYYRGDVDNNNVIFADMCFKIVRTTETGGVKLIYNGLPSNGTCDNTGSDVMIGNSAFNLAEDSLAQVGYMYGDVYESTTRYMRGITSTYYYGNDVTYSNGTYTLVDTISSNDWSSIYNGGLNNYHYTCLGGTTCSSVRYIYYTESSAMHYITLTNGKKVEDALSDMLDNNVTSSTIKENVDSWYYSNIYQKGYSSYIEDIIWCNDRSIYDLGGLNPDGGDPTSYLYFKAHERAYSTYEPSLNCSREVDRFTVSDMIGNGDLDYPVGLITSDELMLSGAKDSYRSTSYLIVRDYFWTGSPAYFVERGINFAFGYAMIRYDPLKLEGVRPSISLTSGMVVIGGDGSVNDPYTLQSTPNIVVDTDSINSIVEENAILDTDIDFSSISSDTNGKGVYIRSGTQNDTYPIYYYRGAVDNNNVLFADMCFKIVRTTETGGVKLIYNGLPTNGTCNNTGNNTVVATSDFNLNYESPAYAGYMYGTVYTRDSVDMSDVTSTYYYGNGVTYSGGSYTLTDTISSSDWSSIYDGGLDNYHYTCMGGTTCDEVYYIYYTSSSTMYYITLANGKTVEGALSDMLDNNTNSSTIKGNNTTSGTLDYWYYTNIEQKGYSSYLEDTIWCNDRTISDLGGWDPDGGSTSSYLYFGAYARVFNTFQPSLSCSRGIDRFTVSSSNGNGDLDYPVGLLTADEIMLAGGKGNVANSSYYLRNDSNWWSATPSHFTFNYALEMDVFSSGTLNYYGVNDLSGLRPAISLKYGTAVSGGDGSANSPYIIFTD